MLGMCGICVHMLCCSCCVCVREGEYYNVLTCVEYYYVPSFVITKKSY